MIPYSLGRNAGLSGLWAAVPYLLAVTAAAGFFLRFSFARIGDESPREPDEYRRIRWKVLLAIGMVIVAAASCSMIERERNIEGKSNDLWGIVTNYEPREGWCDLAVRNPEDRDAGSCNAFLGRTADALAIYRTGKRP